jgi:glycosyltransferase involved in cell wall biosynthesis
LRAGLAIYGDLTNRSGGYLYDAKLSEALKARGHEVVLLSLERLGYQEELSHPPTHELLRRINEGEVDLLVEDELAHPSLIEANCIMRDSLPIISVVHNLSYQVATSMIDRESFAFHERKFLEGVDAFVYNSESTRSAVESLIHHKTLGCVAYPGKDHLGNMPEQERDFDSNTLNLLYVGNLLPYKGLDVLVRALFEQERGRYRVWVAGAPMDVNFADVISTLVKELGLEGEVRLMGRVDDAELKRLLREAHLLAVPSRHEGFGLVYAEAMGHGLPVMASASGGAWEMMEDRVQGFLIPPGDVSCLSQRLELIYHDRELLRSMSRQALMRFEQLPTWQESMSSAVEFLECFLRSY